MSLLCLVYEDSRALTRTSDAPGLARSQDLTRVERLADAKTMRSLYCKCAQSTNRYYLLAIVYHKSLRGFVWGEVTPIGAGITLTHLA